MAENEGWRCPGCGRCYAPTWFQCQHCGPKETNAPKIHAHDWLNDAMARGRAIMNEKDQNDG